jgi:hypothetical protein
VWSYTSSPHPHLHYVHRKHLTYSV